MNVVDVVELVSQKATVTVGVIKKIVVESAVELMELMNVVFVTELESTELLVTVTVKVMYLIVTEPVVETSLLTNVVDAEVKESQKVNVTVGDMSKIVFMSAAVKLNTMNVVSAVEKVSDMTLEDVTVKEKLLDASVSVDPESVKIIVVFAEVQVLDSILDIVTVETILKTVTVPAEVLLW